nr:TIGR00366 family protein [Psychromonas ingrahamii]
MSSIACSLLQLILVSYSGTVPLASGVNLEGVTARVVTSAIGINETLFSTMNLAILAGMLVVIPLLNRAMHPSSQYVITIDP